MRSVVASLFVIICCTCSTLAVQARGRTTAQKSTTRACSLLTKELVKSVSPESAKALDLYFMQPPQEDTLGAGGSDCDYGGMTVQIDPKFSYDAFKKQPGWEHAEPVAGLGEGALFHDNIGEWAELIVHWGPHLLAIRMDVPHGKTAESIKPNVIALAKALLPQIK